MVTPISRQELLEAIAAGTVNVVETLRAEHYADGHLVARGYHNVRRYVAGKQDWVENGLPLERTELAAR